MKVTMNDPIRNVDGSEIKNGESTLVLADVLITALVNSLEADKNEDAVTTLKRWNLAQKIQEARGAVLDITIDEAAFIKERVRKVYLSAIMYGNVHKYLEDATSK